MIIQRHFSKQNNNSVAKDAARAFVTNCFKDQATYDLRGLEEAELEQIKGWQRFFDNHKSYQLVSNHILITKFPMLINSIRLVL